MTVTCSTILLILLRRMTTFVAVGLQPKYYDPPSDDAAPPLPSEDDPPPPLEGDLSPPREGGPTQTPSRAAPPLPLEYDATPPLPSDDPAPPSCRKDDPVPPPPDEDDPGSLPPREDEPAQPSPQENCSLVTAEIFETPVNVSLREDVQLEVSPHRDSTHVVPRGGMRVVAVQSSGNHATVPPTEEYSSLIMWEIDMSDPFEKVLARSNLSTSLNEAKASTAEEDTAAQTLQHSMRKLETGSVEEHSKNCYHYPAATTKQQQHYHSHRTEECYLGHNELDTLGCSTGEGKDREVRLLKNYPYFGDYIGNEERPPNPYPGEEKEEEREPLKNLYLDAYIEKNGKTPNPYPPEKKDDEKQILKNPYLCDNKEKVNRDKKERESLQNPYHSNYIEKDKKVPYPYPDEGEVREMRPHLHNTNEEDSTLTEGKALLQHPSIDNDRSVQYYLPAHVREEDAKIRADKESRALRLYPGDGGDKDERKQQYSYLKREEERKIKDEEEERSQLQYSCVEEEEDEKDERKLQSSYLEEEEEGKTKEHKEKEERKQQYFYLEEGKTKEERKEERKQVYFYLEDGKTKEEERKGERKQQYPYLEGEQEGKTEEQEEKHEIKQGYSHQEEEEEGKTRSNEENERTKQQFSYVQHEKDGKTLRHCPCDDEEERETNQQYLYEEEEKDKTIKHHPDEEEEKVTKTNQWYYREEEDREKQAIYPHHNEEMSGRTQHHYQDEEEEEKGDKLYHHHYEKEENTQHHFRYTEKDSDNTLEKQMEVKGKLVRTSTNDQEENNNGKILQLFIKEEEGKRGGTVGYDPTEDNRKLERPHQYHCEEKDKDDTMLHVYIDEDGKERNFGGHYLYVSEDRDTGCRKKQCYPCEEENDNGIMKACEEQGKIEQDMNDRTYLHYSHNLGKKVSRTHYTDEGEDAMALHANTNEEEGNDDSALFCYTAAEENSDGREQQHDGEEDEATNEEEEDTRRQQNHTDEETKEEERRKLKDAFESENKSKHMGVQHSQNPLGQDRITRGGHYSERPPSSRKYTPRNKLIIGEDDEYFSYRRQQCMWRHRSHPYPSKDHWTQRQYLYYSSSDNNSHYPSAVSGRYSSDSSHLPSAVSGRQSGSNNSHYPSTVSGRHIGSNNSYYPSAVSSRHCNDREDSGSVLQPEELVEVLAKCHGFSSTLVNLHEYQEFEPTQVRQVVAAHPQVFQVDRNGVQLQPQIKLCQSYLSAQGCLRGLACHDLHVCSTFVSGWCSKKHCAMGHSLYTNHNKAILHNFCLTRLPKRCLKNLLRYTTTAALPQSGRLEVCRGYNTGSCDKFDCQALHLCLSFVAARGRCRIQNCTLNHNPNTSNCSRLLMAHGISINETIMDIIVALLSANPTLTAADATVPSSATETPTTQAKPAPAKVNRPTSFFGHVRQRPGLHDNHSARNASEGTQSQRNRASHVHSKSDRDSSELRAVGGQEAESNDSPPRQAGSQPYGDRNPLGRVESGQRAVLVYHRQGTVRVSEICRFSVEAICFKQDKGCPRLHASRPFHWQVGDGSGQDSWLNLPGTIINCLETAFCDPAMNRVKLPPMKPAQLHRLKNELDQDTWYANFEAMVLTNSDYSKVIQLRRLCVQEGASSPYSKSRTYNWYFCDINGRWVKYGQADTSGQAGRLSSITSADIEAHFLVQPNVPLSFKVSQFKYSINFGAMTQTNLSTKIERPVRRRPELYHHTSTPLSSNSGSRFLPMKD